MVDSITNKGPGHLRQRDGGNIRVLPITSLAAVLAAGLVSPANDTGQNLGAPSHALSHAARKIEATAEKPTWTPQIQIVRKDTPTRQTTAKTLGAALDTSLLQRLRPDHQR